LGKKRRGKEEKERRDGLHLASVFFRKVNYVSSFYPAQAIKKLLDRAKRCLMQFLRTAEHVKANAKLMVQRTGVVSNHVKTAAFRRTLGSERADYYVPSRFDRAGYLSHVGNPLLG
jgi:hypothetical protein